MKRNWLLIMIAIREVFSLKNTSNGELAHKAKHGLKIHRLNPVTVMNNSGSFWIKNLHSLVNIGLCVCIHLLCSERRTGRIASGRVSDQRGAATNNQGDIMAKVLELTHLAQRNCVSQMQIRTCWINAKLNIKRGTLLEFFF